VVVKTVSLGESELIAGVTAVLGLAAFATVFCLTLHKLWPPVSWAVSYCAAVPFPMFRRRFGQLQLTTTDGALHFYPHGPLFSARTFPIEAIRSISELRLSDSELVWAIVVEFVDGTRTQLDKFRSSNIHELVAELNASFVLGDKRNGVT
jgi:hypothetical protein